MEIGLQKGESVEIYCPWGGGVELHLTATDKGLQVVNMSSRLEIREKRTKYSREWLLSCREEHGFDRT